MNSYKRLNDSGTRDFLISAARKLFAQDGFRGTSVRDITKAANTNLGAVTYHFGSKRELFHAVLDDATTPVRKHVAALKDSPGTPMDKIDETIRGLFAALRSDPEIPRLIVHVLASPDPLPPPILATMEVVIGHLTSLIESGQRNGSLRPGSPQMLALTCGSQPIFFGIYRRALQEAVGLDQSDERTSQHLTETVLNFIHGGLTGPQGQTAQRQERN